MHAAPVPHDAVGKTSGPDPVPVDLTYQQQSPCDEHQADLQWTAGN